MNSKNKYIILKCPNYYHIINFNYIEGDYFTANMIKIYQSYIFTIDIRKKEDVDKIISLDKIIAKYLDDYLFRKEMKIALTNVTFKKDIHLLDNLINTIIDTFKNMKFTKRYVSKWI